MTHLTGRQRASDVRGRAEPHLHRHPGHLFGHSAGRHDQHLQRLAAARIARRRQKRESGIELCVLRTSSLLSAPALHLSSPPYPPALCSLPLRCSSRRCGLSSVVLIYLAGSTTAGHFSGRDPPANPRGPGLRLHPVRNRSAFFCSIQPSALAFARPPAFQPLLQPLLQPSSAFAPGFIHCNLSFPWVA